MKGLQRQKRYSILNILALVWAWERFGGKFPFLSKVFLEELRCSTRGVQGHVRAWAAWIYYDLERDPKHLLNTSWQSEENTVDCSLSEHTIQYFVCPSEYTWLYLNFMNNTPNFGNSLDVTWKLHQARHERVSGLSRIDFACRSKLLAAKQLGTATRARWICFGIGSWRLILLERIKSFRFSMISRVSVFFCHVTAWHYQVWPSPNLENLNLSASRLSGFADMCQMFAEFVVGLRVISCDFMGRFQIAHNNPQTPKNTMDIQTVFQIRNCRSFRSVWHQDP